MEYTNVQSISIPSKDAVELPFNSMKVKDDCHVCESKDAFLWLPSRKT